MTTDTGTQDFLFELGTEELPPKSLKQLAQALEQEVCTGLAEAGLQHGEVSRFAAPRRLALRINALQDRQADREFERRGPAVKAAFDDAGKPTRAAEGFASSCGIAVSDLEQVETDKGAYLVYRGTEPGQATTALLPAILDRALDRLPVAKRMRWGSHRFEFVRPVKWLLALWGEDVLPYEAFGLTADNLSYGHRIHAPEAIAIRRPADYETVLRDQGWVLAGFEARRDYIRNHLSKAADEHGVQVVVEDDLLDEVTALNEWPVVLSGQFEQRFLDVPAEALVSSMQEHQKYFPARSDSGELVNRFFFVANLESRDPELVVSGNEKVIRPRLADAAFFWESDLKTPLAERVAKLDKVVFQKQLGTVGDKARRIEKLTTHLAGLAGADQTIAGRGALLAKADLVTDLVFEFDDLQGTAGYYYALRSGEPAGVASAIRDHYRPAFAGDALPETLEGSLVALADRLDTLVGIFAIGQKPTGTRDPFALRRASLGILRLLIEKALPLDLRALLNSALAGYGKRSLPARDTAVDEALAYVLERFRAWYQDQSVPTDVFYSVRELALTVPLDIHRRVSAVSTFKDSSAAASLSEANKRVANLLAKADADLSRVTGTTALTEPAEAALLERLQALETEVPQQVAQHDYAGALKALSSLKEPLDQFFAEVMVMAEDADLRQQRLALLYRVRQLFLQVADISLLQL
ncbi:glycine--tRNA ligase subunit beta [Natronospirillum operosum]|uniref:Glycine--tRNA ligase beta subunit n=1 Tax=Natronospirillum operosum TaxID=2759953 RepID=A0A4Z0W7H5_9GAMM|nr:glycine--tRNA ligase subunit beta [Natronospirillum operosum]TGG91500.1 glycine--tRNA ligase subunit beta [Natronospirillum operosum]